MTASGQTHLSGDHTAGSVPVTVSASFTPAAYPFQLSLSAKPISTSPFFFISLITLSFKH